MSMKSDALEQPTDIMKRLGKVPNFLDIMLKQDTPNNKTNISVILTKFVLTFNFSTYKRLMKFLEKIQNYSAAILTPTQPEEDQSVRVIESSKAKIKEKLDLIQSKKDEYIHKSVNKKFMPRLLDKVKARKEIDKKNSESNLDNENDLKCGNVNDSNADKMSIGEKSVASKRQSIMENSLNNYRKEFVKQKLKFSFEMKQIELNIPLDPESQKTKAIVFNFNTMMKVKQISESDCYYEKSSNKLVIQNYLKKNLFVNAMLFNIDFDMYNVVQDQIIFNLLNNKILSNSRITLFVKSFLIPAKKSEIMSVDVKVEPITMIIGFRQIRIIKDFLEIMQKSLTPPPEEKETLYFDKASDDNIDPLTLNKETKIVEFNKNEKDSKKMLGIDEEKQSKNASAVDDALSKKLNKIEKKIEDQVKYNTSLFNKLTDINFILEKASIKLIDNTESYEKPLTMIELSKISLKMINNTNPYDIDNMVQALLEMLCDQKPKNLNISNLYMYLDAYFSIEMSSFNERVSDWEPILEPWSGNFKIIQIDKITRQKLEFKSDYMMNFNLSVQSVDVLNAILKKLNQTEANWRKEELNRKNQLLNLSEKNDNNTKISHMKNSGDTALLFENRSGLDITFNFLADEKNKFVLHNNYQKSFTKNDLLQIYSNLTEEIAIKKKDKFSFMFNDFQYWLEDVDFSYNHFFVKKIPLYKAKNDEKNVTSFNLQNEKDEKKDKKNKQKTKEDKAKAKEKQEANKKSGYIRVEGEDPEVKALKEEEKDKFVEICIKIKNNGLVKVISVESNIGMYNNTTFVTNLCFFNNKKYKLDQIYSNNGLDMSKCSEMLKCNPHSGLQIPLKFIVEPHLIFLSIAVEKDEPESYNLLFNDFTSIYSMGREYNKAVIDNHLYEDTQKKAEFVNKMTKEKCMQIKFENNNKIAILSMDILMLKTKNHLITSLEKDETLSSKAEDELFYYQLILNPPVAFENKIPYDVNINYKYSDKLAKEETKNTNENCDPYAESKYNSNVYILPLDKYKIYNFDMQENFVDLVFIMNYQNQSKYSSKRISSKDLSKDKNYISLSYDNNPKDNFEMVCEISPLPTNKFYDYNYLNVENFFSKSKIFLCYFDFILINRLEENILIRPNTLDLKTKNSEEETKLLESLHCYKLASKSLNLFSTPRNNSKAKIKVLNSEWSEQFEMAAHGLEAGHSVLIPDPVNSSNKINYEFATIITSSNNFNYSTILIIEPRHIMINKTGLDLKFRQVLSKDHFSKETQLILNDSEKVVKLTKYANEKHLKNIQFFINSGFHDNEDLSNDLWSQVINIDNLQEYNLAIYLPHYFDFKKSSQIDPAKTKNIYQYDEHCKFYLIRVTLQTMDNGLIYIILSEPKFPQFLVKNVTKEIVKIKQNGTNIVYTIAPGTLVPYTLRDLQLADSGKSVEIEILNKKATLSLDTIEETSQLVLDKEKDLKNSLTFASYNSNINNTLNIEEQEKDNLKQELLEKLENPTVFFSVSTDNKNVTRIININTNFDDEEGLIDAKQHFIAKKMKASVVNFTFKIKGIGLSIIDSFPKEVFYISFYHLTVILRNYVAQNDFVISRYANYVIYLKNFQVDYCLEGSFNQIIYPKNQYIPFKLNQIKKEDHTDFVELMVTKAFSTNIQNDSETDKIAQIQFILQEFNVKIDQQVINVLLELINQFVNRFDFYKEEVAGKNENYAESDAEGEVEDLDIIKEINPRENLTRVNTAQRNKDLINNEDIKLLNKNSAINFSKTQTGTNTKRLSSQKVSSRRATSGVEKFVPEPTMSVNIYDYQEVLKKSDESGIYNIGKLFISGIKINLTLRIDISSLEISLVPAFVTKLLGTVGNALARITDSPLSFSELTIPNIYNNMNYIIGFMIGKYKSQGIMQVYKILGSSDLIGNPVSLVSKVGTGFLEFFNEPRKGFVDGPIQFGTGVAKGVNSLVSNVVGGGLDAVGKITGTLYNATK